jgi:hypothetical protein
MLPHWLKRMIGFAGQQQIFVNDAPRNRVMVGFVQLVKS